MAAGTIGWLWWASSSSDDSSDSSGPDLAQVALDACNTRLQRTYSDYHIYSRTVNYKEGVEPNGKDAIYVTGYYGEGEKSIGRIACTVVERQVVRMSGDYLGVQLYDQ